MAEQTEKPAEPPAAAAESPAAAEAKRLAPDEVIAKLNRIPAFCLGDADGDVLVKESPDGGEHIVVWHTDPGFARKELAEAHTNGAATARLQCSPLGMIAAVAAGWADNGSQACKCVIASNQIALATVAKATGQDLAELTRQWKVPIFFSTQVLRKDGLPIFLNPMHLKHAHEQVQKQATASGKELAELQMQVGDLLELMQQMVSSDEHDWKTFVFVGDSSALELAVECNEKKPSPAAGESAAGKAGAGASAASSAASIAAKQQLVARLDTVPVFTLADAKGSVFMRSDPSTGESFVPWMVEGGFAMQTLKLAHER
jgi:hypothetical protein